MVKRFFRSNFSYNEIFNPVPIPNLLTDQFFKEGVGFMSDARVL